MAKNKLLWCLLALLCQTQLFAQNNRYVIYFSDKAHTSWTVENPGEFLSQKAIERRARQNIAITANDLPVSPAYVDSLENMDVDVYFKSRWFNAVLVETDPETVEALEQKSYVIETELAAPGSFDNARRSAISQMLISKDVSKTLPTDFQNEMLGVTAMHDDGYKGEGVLIAVFDGGFLNVNESSFFSHLFEESRIVHQYDFIGRDESVFKYDSHGTNVLSCLAAYDPERYEGAAYKADYALFITEDVTDEYRIEEYYWLFAAEMADSLGADIISSSLGYNVFHDGSMDYDYEDMDGKTAVVTRAASAAASRGMLVVTSAGNEGANGWKHIVAPADADSVLSVGAVDHSSQRVYFSSVGPAADERIKPEVAALGLNTKIVTAEGSIANGNGTSFAAPLISGLAAGLWQANPSLNNWELIQLIKSSANLFQNPNNELGYGIPDYRAAQYLLNDLQDRVAIDGISVYPNPFKENHFFIKPSPRFAALQPEVEMFNMAGDLLYRLQMRKSPNSFVYEVNLPNIPSGVYILAIASDGGVNKVKIVKN